MITPSSNSVSQETVSEAVEMILGQRNLVTEHVGRQKAEHMSSRHELQCEKPPKAKKKFIWEYLSKKRFNAGHKKLGAGALG